MPYVHESVVVEAPPDDVWTVVADPAHLTHGNRYIREVHDVPPGGLARGSRYRATLGIAGLTFDVSVEAIDVDPPRSATVALAGPAIRATMRTTVRADGPGRSSLEHDIEYRMRGGLVGVAVGRAVDFFGGATLLKMALEEQKELVEACARGQCPLSRGGREDPGRGPVEQGPA